MVLQVYILRFVAASPSRSKCVRVTCGIMTLIKGNECVTSAVDITFMAFEIEFYCCFETL